MNQGLVKEDQNEAAEVMASIGDTQSTESAPKESALKKRVVLLEEKVALILKAVNINSEAVSPPKMFENNNPDILPIGGETRGYKDVRQI